MTQPQTKLPSTEPLLHAIHLETQRSSAIDTQHTTLDGTQGSREEWESCNLWQGAQVILSTALSSIEGRVLGVDSRGALRLEVDGVEQGFSGGELSLRLRQ